MTPVAESGQRATIACPRCAAPVGAEQDWCLACGDAARTRLVPTPNWHAPVALLAVIALVAGVALALAFVALTNDNEPAAPTNSQAPPPSAATGAPQPTTSTPTAPPSATTAPSVNTATTAPTTPTTTTAPGTTATTPTAPGG